MEPLDNPVWYALNGPHRDLAERHDRATRYPIDVTPFAALPDEPDEDDWQALLTLAGGDGWPVLVRRRVAPPPGWELRARWATRQMVAPSGPLDVDRSEVVIDALTPDDVPEMLDLVERTQPGPFRSGTITLGSYLGVREEGRLVAMAGERLSLGTATEISAVCTDPGVRGRGLARTLLAELVDRIHARGEVALLHVVDENAGAIRVYEQLGFEEARRMDVAMLQPSAENRSARHQGLNV